MDLYLVLSNITDTKYVVKEACTSEESGRQSALAWQGVCVRVPMELISDYRPHYRR